MYVLFVDYLKPGVGEEQLKTVIPDHVAWINDQIAAGRIVQAGKWGDLGGAVIFQAQSVDEVETWLAEDPLVISGHITYQTAQFWPMREPA